MSKLHISNYNLQGESNSKRYTYLDSIAGILLTYMIIMHCAQWSSVYFMISKYTCFLGFFMPWFFFKGGMFYKPKTSIEIINKGYHRLLIPFIVFSIIGTILLWGLYAVKSSLSITNMIYSIGIFLIEGSFPGNLSLWFLISLFFVRIIFNYIFNLTTKNHAKGNKILGLGLLILLCMLFIPLYYIRLKYKVLIPYYIFNISIGLTFYSCGYYLKKFNPQTWIVLFIILCYLIMVIIFPISNDMRTGNSSNILLLIPHSLLGILSFNLVGKKILNFNNIFSYIGKDTMPFYCIHWCVIELVALFFTGSEGPNLKYFGILLLANLIILPIATNLLNNSRMRVIFHK